MRARSSAICKMSRYSSLTILLSASFNKCYQSMTRGCIQVASFIQKMWTINKTKRVGCRVGNRDGPVICRGCHYRWCRSYTIPIKTTELSPLTWWKGLRKYNFPEGFCFCWVFSTFGLVHRKPRNGFGVAKAAKLVLCYRMLRGHTYLDYWITPNHNGLVIDWLHWVPSFLL